MIDPTRASNAGDLGFAGAGRKSHVDTPVPLGGVPRALREVGEAAGLEPLASLYNEALRYAHEGHLRLARERLQMLLCMAPDDGDARLLLARVFVAGQRWSDALGALDEATDCGVDVPMSLRRAVEDHLRSERLVTEEQINALKAREQGEVQALRLEARRLRSDGAEAAGQMALLEREVRKWAWATASVSALSIVFIIASLALEVGGAGEPEQAPQVAAEEGTPVLDEGALEPPTLGADAEGEAPRPLPVFEEPRLSVAERQARLEANVRDALASSGLEGHLLRATIVGDRVTLTGEVDTNQRRKIAERILSGLDGVAAVDGSHVRLGVRSKGGVHVVVRGDTLSHVAQAYYGDAGLAGIIEQANGLEGGFLKVGQRLTLPPVQGD